MSIENRRKRTLHMKFKIASIIMLAISIVAGLVFASCSAADPFEESTYFRTLYVWNGVAWNQITTNGGGGGGGDVATDAIWDIKGDLAVGTNPDTAVRLAVGLNGQVLAVDLTEATGLKWVNAGTGDVTAAANMADNTIIKGDGGLKGVQDSGVTIDDFDNIDTNGGDITGFDIYADNDVNITNDLDVFDDADVGGDLAVTGTITEGGNGVLNTSDVDDAAVDGATTDPISSNWAFDHESNYNAHGIITIFKGLSETVNNSNVLQDDDNFYWNIPAHTIHDLRLFIIFDSGTTPDFKFDLNGTGTAWARWYTSGDIGSSSSGSTFSLTFAGSTTTISGSGAGIFKGFIVYALIAGGNDGGTITFRWAQNTANASDTHVDWLSYAILTQVV